MKEVTPIPFGLDGWVYRADPYDRRRVPHRHEELEMNLVLRPSIVAPARHFHPL